MHRLIRTFVLLSTIVAGGGFFSVASADQIAVVELFTSQGCSSCPPVDEMVGKMAKQDELIVLSFHVDYWNYIGWKDPFSSPEATERQKGYRRALKKSYVYTPQVIVDGTTEIRGRKKSEIAARVKAARKRAKLNITLTQTGDGLVDIRIPAGHHWGPAADIWVAVYDNQIKTDVRAGENKGKTLINTNVVRAFQRIGRWRGKELTLTLPLVALGGKGHDGCAIIVQRPNFGPILGAKNLQLAGNPS